MRTSSWLNKLLSLIECAARLHAAAAAAQTPAFLLALAAARQTFLTACALHNREVSPPNGFAR